MDGVSCCAPVGRRALSDIAHNSHEHSATETRLKVKWRPKPSLCAAKQEAFLRRRRVGLFIERSEFLLSRPISMC